MPFETIWEKRGFYIRFWETVPDSEVMTMINRFSNDPRSDKCLYKIYDATEVEAFTSSENDIIKYASNDIGMASYLKNFSVVLIGSKAEIRKAFRLYISTCLRVNMTWRFHICDTLDQAREWLTQQDESREADLGSNSSAQENNIALPSSR